MERMWVGVTCNCVYGNEEESGVNRAPSAGGGEVRHNLWTDPAGVTALMARWTEKLAGGPQTGTSDSPH